MSEIETIKEKPAAISPPNPKLEGLFQKANDFFKQGNYDNSKKHYEEILKLDAKNIKALAGLGAVFINVNDFDSAIKQFEAVLAIDPKQPAVLSNLSVALLRKNKFQESLEKAEEAIALNAKFADAYLNRGQALTRLERIEESLEATTKGIELNPRNPNAYNLRAVILQNMNRLDEALQDYDRAIMISRDQVSAYFNKGYLKLLMGDFWQGWRLFEWRWKGLLKKHFRNFPQPLWLGDYSIKGKTLLITQEQGFGDFIQFARYIPMVKKMGAHIVVECDPIFLRFLSSLNCDVTPTEKKKPLPAFDCYCPILSLPLAFNMSLDNIPNKVPYVFVEKSIQDETAKTLGKKTKMRVGLVWSGSKNADIDMGYWRKRSVTLKTIEPILNVEADFYIIQKDVDAEESKELKNYPNIKERSAPPTDFIDTAALINEMDLVITVDTASAHLAGALGKKTWIMIPFVHDYRWLTNRLDNPWYPEMTLFRQEKAGDWEPVVKDIADQLKKLIK